MNSLMTKSFVSYVDLKKEALKDLEKAEGTASDPRLSVELTSDANLRSFFEQAELVRDEMASIRDLLAKLQSGNDDSKSAQKPDALRSIRTRINSDIVQILRKARSIKAHLEAMDHANAENRRLSGYREGTPIDRTRTSVTNGLRLKLKELMLEFQDLRQRMMAEYKETVERRYFTLTGEVAEEEVIERIIADGESEDLVRKAMRMSSENGKGVVMETVHEIRDRYDGAKEVERSLLELHQLFLDMAVMVEAQGERMDDIEHHVVNAADYVRDGTKELKIAKEHQRGSRKWMCLGIIVLLILVLLIVVPILASLRKDS